MLKQFLKDILFPLYCVGCEREGEWCCAKCVLTIEPRSTQECPVCYRSGDGKVCGGCVQSSALNGVIALYQYQDSGSLGQLIKQLKYQHARDTIKTFKALAHQARSVYENFLCENPVMVIPVPLHIKRRRERGFNQAELLAKIFIKVLKEVGLNTNGIHLETSSLVRVRSTEQQARLSHDERVTNLHDAFRWQGKAVPERVFLVDDVFTTGSTLQAAAGALKQAGVQEIWGLTLARGKMS